jgi:8-oxo-dGTP pyrophosphatase MutT (NUDIX family)
MCSPPSRANLAPLFAALDAFTPRDTRDEDVRRRMHDFALAHECPFDRCNPVGHFTASGLVVAPNADRVCLGYHRKLGAWLQFGGHAEPAECDPHTIALRETQEESGLRDLIPAWDGPAPLDLDIHAIPARDGFPAHEHLDLRYLFIADPAAPTFDITSEHHAIRWFTIAELDALALDASLRRSIERSREWLRCRTRP